MGIAALEFCFSTQAIAINQSINQEVNP